jgi:hypothetical protein
VKLTHETRRELKAKVAEARLQQYHRERRMFLTSRRRTKRGTVVTGAGQDERVDSRPS